MWFVHVRRFITVLFSPGGLLTFLRAHVSDILCEMFLVFLIFFTCLQIHYYCYWPLSNCNASCISCDVHVHQKPLNLAKGWCFSLVTNWFWSEKLCVFFSGLVCCCVFIFVDLFVGCHMYRTLVSISTHFGWNSCNSHRQKHSRIVDAMHKYRLYGELKLNSVSSLHLSTAKSHEQVFPLLKITLLKVPCT